MPTYNYVARDGSGSIVSGNTPGVEEALVRRDLRAKGLYVVSLLEQRERNGLGGGRFGRLKIGDLVVFSHQLSTMVAAGLPILDSLRELSDETDSPVLRRALAKIVQDVQTGSTLSQSMARHPRVFSELMVALVNAGEIGGLLESSLETIAKDLDKEAELREKVKSAFVYPIMVLCTAGGVVTFMLLFVIPVFQGVYTQFKAALPAPTQALITVSNFISHRWWLALLLLVGGVMGLRSFRRTKTGKELWDRAALRLPVLGKLVRRMVVTRLVRTLGALVGAGVPILAALETSARVANNAEFTDAMRQVGEEVSRGASLAGPLRATRLFPNLVPRMVQAGEDSGNLEQMLITLAEFLDRDVEHMVRRLTALMEPVLTLVLGAIVGAVVIALYMPIFTLAQVVKR